MLKELSKKDKLWRTIAYNICKNKFLADEIVQEMYLRFHRNPKDKVNDYYVALVLKSLYLNMLKERTNTSLNDFHYIEDKNTEFQPNDEEQAVLDEIGKLSWTQKELLAEIYDRSYRDIESIYNINYGYLFLQVKKAKEKVWQNLKKRK